MINIPPTRQLADPGATGRQWSPSNSVANAVGGIGDAIGNLGDRLAAHQIKINRAKTSRDISERMLELAQVSATMQNDMLTSTPDDWPSDYEARFKGAMGKFDKEKGSLSPEGQAVFDSKAAEFYGRSAIQIGAASEMAIVTEARQARAFEIDLSKKNLDQEGGMTAINEGGALGISQGAMEREAHEFNGDIAMGRARLTIQNAPFTWSPKVLEEQGHTPDEVRTLTREHKVIVGQRRTEAMSHLMNAIADPDQRVTVAQIDREIETGALEHLDKAKLIRLRQEYTTTDYDGFLDLFEDMRKYDRTEDTPDKVQLNELMERGAFLELHTDQYQEMNQMFDKIQRGPLLGDSLVPKELSDGVFNSLNIALSKGDWGMEGTAINKKVADRTPIEAEAIVERQRKVAKEKALMTLALNDFIAQNDFEGDTRQQVSDKLEGALDGLLKLSTYKAVSGAATSKTGAATSTSLGSSRLPQDLDDYETYAPVIDPALFVQPFSGVGTR
jgi:hypothetical protein